MALMGHENGLPPSPWMLRDIAAMVVGRSLGPIRSIARAGVGKTEKRMEGGKEDAKGGGEDGGGGGQGGGGDEGW